MQRKFTMNILYLLASVFSIKANVQNSQCPAYNSESFEKIEGFR